MKEIKNTVKNIFWIYQEMNPKCKWTLFSALLLILGSSFIPSIIPTYMGKMLNNSDNINYAYVTLCIIGGLYLLDLFLEAWRKYLIDKTISKEQNEWVVKALDRLIRLDINWLNKQGVGGINSRIQRSVEGAIKLLKLFIMDFLPAILKMVFAVTVALYTNIYISLVLISAVIIGSIIVVKQIQSQKGIRMSLIRTKEDVESFSVEVLTGIESVRIANEEEVQIRRIASSIENLRSREIKHHVKNMGFDVIKKSNIVVWNMVVLFIGVLLASHSVISVGEIVVLNMLFNNAIAPINSIHHFLDDAHESSLKTNDLRDLFCMPIDSSYMHLEGNGQSSNIESAISIRCLSVDYGEKKVIENIDVEFGKGKYYGIVGGTGCGKSTLLKTVMNLIHPASGSIHIFGKDIRSISKEKLAGMIVFMPQKPFIFNGTIRDNILFGCKANQPTDNDLLWALQQACILDEIKNKGGLDFHVNERGSNLSGGQCQRLALARVFLCIKYMKNEHIIILDEATSALDNETEETVINNLLALADSRTTILAIAHRYSTLKKTDCIIDMNKGAKSRYVSFEELAA